MAKRQQTRKEHRERVMAVLAFIRDHSVEDLSVDQLASVAYQSPYHFERVFQMQTGLSVMAHVRNFRLIRSAIELRTSQRKIIDIAHDAGYARHESFSRAFRSYFGESPSYFRKRISVDLNNQEGLIMQNFKVGLVKIPVTDFTAATTYYREVIGLEEEFAVEAYGWAQYKTGTVPLCLYVTGQGGGDGQPGGEIGFHLVVDRLQEFYDGVKQRGGLFASEIVGSADGGMFVVICDRDGNKFKVMQNSSSG